jgi:2-polyprenyl-6-hydroxyphenyl methylase/3-demethylubiquinone-9 3-methyltransferase
MALTEPTIACRGLDQAIEKPVPDEATRFDFGENWRRFADDLPPRRLEAAQASLVEMLGGDALRGKTFLDIGSGSGLFSLSAILLGASKVHSLDYDPISVETTDALRRRFAPEAAWTVERADVLDREHMASLGSWDVVYAWGVLHHTGRMWDAMEVACDRVAAGGNLFVSIYNDQGRLSAAWKAIKRLYNRLPIPLRAPYAVLVACPMELRALAGRALRLRPQEYFRLWSREEGYGRGMSRWRDLVDWIGGYPFEVARPAEVIAFCSARGFRLQRCETVGRSHGCNEFVFAAPRGDDR